MSAVPEVEELEAQARKLCGLHGVDPDKFDSYPRRNEYGVHVFRPMWRMAAEDLRSYITVQEALRI